jgi:hypothetical protein
MDGRKFDNLTKALTTATRSRRGMLRPLVGGALATVLGAVALDRARAKGVGTEAFDLTCQQAGVNFFCEAAAPDVTTCGPSTSGCVCAEAKQSDKGPYCIQQPTSGCPSNSNKCKKNNECGSGEVCIIIPDCCPNNPNRGKCVKKCPSS